MMCWAVLSRKKMTTRGVLPGKESRMAVWMSYVLDGPLAPHEVPDKDS
jgi:hypothetical protein